MADFVEILKSSSAHLMTTADEKKRCSNCFTSYIFMKQFARCDHFECCLKCSEQQMLESLKNGSEPQCMNLYCNAKMIISENSMFTYFSERSKNIYYTQMKKIQSKQIEISVQNQCSCGGKIVNFRCQRCKQFVCQKCGGPQHKIGQSCIVFCKYCRDQNFATRKFCGQCGSANWKSLKTRKSGCMEETCKLI